MRSISLRFKLTYVFVFLLSIAVGIFSFVARSLIVQDKTQALEESTSSVARSKAEAAAQILNQNILVAQNLIMNYSMANEALRTPGRLLAEMYPDLRGVSVFQVIESAPHRWIHWERDTSSASSTDLSRAVSAALFKEKESLLFLPPAEFLFVTPLKNEAEKKALAVRIRSKELVDLFESNQDLNIGIIAQDANSVLTSEPPSAITQSELLSAEMTKSIENSKKIQVNGQDYYAASVQIAPFSFYTLAIAPEKSGLQVLQRLNYQTFLFFIFMVSAGAILTFLSVQVLTHRLKKMEASAQQISNGDFNIQLGDRRGDEIGTLGRTLESMAKKIQTLLQDSVQKARMESELKVAKTVQETLFPPPTFSSDRLQGAGFYLSASECGGDLWHTFQNQEWRYVLIFDATGHGAGPALVTSAVRAILSLFDEGAPPTLTTLTEKINRAIYETSKGQILMTAFLCRIHLPSGQLEFVNCSHEPPFVLAKNDKEPRFMTDPNHQRLGQATRSEYLLGEEKIRSGERVFLYTDGAKDLTNKEGRPLSERKWMRLIQECHQEHVSEQDFMNSVSERLLAYSDANDIPDDMTMVSWTWN